jgi:hypothetical protein
MSYPNVSSGNRFPVEAVVFAIWAVAGLVGSFVVPGPDKSLQRVLLWTTLACSYLLYELHFYLCFSSRLTSSWFMVYMSQKYCILLPVDTRFQGATPEVREFNARIWGGEY